MERRIHEWIVNVCVNGPQAMTGVTAVNLATKSLAGTAEGFTSLFSYASVLASGWGMGWFADATGGWGAPPCGGAAGLV